MLGIFVAKTNLSLPNFLIALDNNSSFFPYTYAVSKKLIPYSKAFPISSIPYSSEIASVV